MENKKLTINNIDTIREEIECNYYGAVKTTVLNLIETSYEDELENNKIEISYIDEIVSRVVESEDFNDYVDSIIQNEIANVFKENNINVD